MRSEKGFHRPSDPMEPLGVYIVTASFLKYEDIRMLKNEAFGGSSEPMEQWVPEIKNFTDQVIPWSHLVRPLGGVGA